MLQLLNNTWEKSCVLAAAVRKFRTNFNTSKDDKSSENVTKEKDEKEKAADQPSAKEKLNDLLQTMMKSGTLTNTKEEGLALAKAKTVVKPKAAKTMKQGIAHTEDIDQKLIKATKDVAENLGGDVKETESELLQKLLSPKGSTNISDLIGGMVIDHGDAFKTRQDITKDWNQIKREVVQMRRPQRLGGRQSKQTRSGLTHVDLFGGPRLGIFDKGKVSSQEIISSNVKVWEKEEERDIRLATSHPPRNYFQQMILWTEQGKVWHFPIDNEQGLEEEKKVFFTEHVFLEPNLEPWCPKKGPIRHFMELVCVGLSKNPFMTVQEKKDTINWYAEYFEAKKDILKEVGAIPK